MPSWLYGANAVYALLQDQRLTAADLDRPIPAPHPFGAGATRVQINISHDMRWAEV